MSDPSPVRKLLGATAQLADLVVRAAAHATLLARDARSDARAVARDAEELWALLLARGAELAGAVRATPRLARVLGEALRVAALLRFEAALGDAGGRDGGRAAARRVRELCVELRGGVLKLGQIASSRADLLPPAAIAELAQLQDRVPPLPDELIRAHVAAELGRPLDEVFASFGPAIAAASLAQVHGATLQDGTEVAVKVLVPGIEAIVEADLHALRVLAAALRDSLPGIDTETLQAELSRAIRAELDLCAEAAALAEFADRFAGRADVHVPRPYPELTTTRVLVMGKIDGARLGDYLAAAERPERDRVVTTLVDCFAEQILEHGVFHADPHPGNFLVTAGAADGGLPRVALLDFGCVMRLPPGVPGAYAALLAALLSRDAARAAALLATLGFSTRDGDPGTLLELAELMIAPLRDAAADPMTLVARALAVVQQNPVARVPEHFVLVGRVLGTLGGLVAAHPPAAGLLGVLARHLVPSARAP
jgi:ubiquinone biosynthesis protein